MPFDEHLAKRLRSRLKPGRGFDEKRMFGGIAFLLNGNMCVGVWKDQLIVRVGPGADAPLLREEGVHPFDITGRPMNGWIMVAPESTREDFALDRWVGLAEDFVRTLPHKSAKKRRL